MPTNTAARFYEPLIGGSDKLVRRPLRPWRTSLLASLAGAVGNEVRFDKIATSLNQLALLEAYEGNSAGALALCDAQIAFWKAVSDGAGRGRYLAYAIQPAINVMRLERWTATERGQVSLYAELSPEGRIRTGMLQARYGIGLSFEQLCRVDSSADYAALVNNVYWREYARYLLQAGEYAPLQALLAQGINVQQAPFIRATLLEILVLLQARCGRYEGASRLLEKMAIPVESMHWLHFKVLAMYVAMQVGAPAALSLLDEVIAALRNGGAIARDAYGLNLLFDISKVFRELGLTAEETELLTRAGQLAAELDDEVVRFDALERLATLAAKPGAALPEQFGQSTYASIRKRLGLAPAAVTCPDPRSALLEQAVQRLARLDYAGCAALLAGTRIGAPAAATM